jgi:predicted small secreted protein
MKHLIKPLLCSLFVVVLVGIASGCKNTAKGIGKDMENAGEKIQEKTE